MQTRYKAKIKSEVFRIIVCLALVFAITGFTPGEESHNSSFTWAFLHKSDNGKISAIDFDEAESRLSETERLKIFIKHGAGVYVYLVLLDAEDGLSMLYPRSFDYYTKPEESGEQAYIPPGSEWFKFKQGAGTERFYLLASEKRLFALEGYVTAYKRQARENAKLQDAKYESKSKVIEELRRLLIENYPLVKKSKSEIYLVAGEFRGLEESFDFPACRVLMEEFYERVIRISH